MKGRMIFFILLSVAGIWMFSCTSSPPRALKKSSEKPSQKTSPFLEQEKVPVYAILGFHGENTADELWWVGYGMAYFIPQKIRLITTNVLVLDDNQWVSLMPAVEPRLFLREPPEDTLKQLKKLLRVDELFYFSYSIQNSQVTLNMHHLSQQGSSVQSFQGELSNLPALEQEASVAVAKALKIDPSPLTTQYLHTSPATPEAYKEATYGFYYASLAWYSEAALHLRKVITLDPLFTDAYTLLAEIYLLREMPDPAIQILQDVVEKKPEDYYLWFLLGKAYYLVERVNEAEKALEKSRSLNPDFQDVHALLAGLYAKTGKEEARESSVRYFLKSNPATGAQIYKAEKFVYQFLNLPETKMLEEELRPYVGRTSIQQSRLNQLSTHATYQTEWFLGKSEAGYRKPVAITSSPDGTLYVVDSTIKSILAYAPDGKIIRTYDIGGLLQPHSIAIGPPSSSLYITDTLYNQVYRLSLKTGMLEKFTDNVLKPTGIVYTQGKICVLDGRRYEVRIFDLEGKFLKSLLPPRRLWTNTMEPVDLDVGPDGNLYILDSLTNQIAVMNLQGKLVWRIGGAGFGPGEFTDPKGLSIDRQGRIAVADSYLNRIQVLNPDGTPLALFGVFGGSYGQFADPNDLLLKSSGLLYIADKNNGRIQIFQIH